MTIQEDSTSALSLTVLDSDLHHIEDVKNYTYSEKSVDWKFGFTLVASDKNYEIFMRTPEEQFLWLTAFYRLLGVPVKDARYRVPKRIRTLYDVGQCGDKIFEINEDKL